MELNRDLKLKLVTCSPLDFENTVVYQPTISKIIDMGETKLDDYLLPFGVNLEVFDIPAEEKVKFKTFDLFFAKEDGVYALNKDNVGFIHILVDSLKFFFKTYDVVLYEPSYSIIINKSVKIDRENFDKLQDLILLICQREKPRKKEAEEEPVFTNEAHRQRYERFKKLQRESERKKAEEEAEKLCIANIINAVEITMGSIDYERTSLYKLIHLYKNMLSKESYDRTMDIVSSGMVDTKKAKLDTTHWTDKIKI